MLLNKIPVLDKGFVALIDSCNTTSKLREVGQEFFGGEYPTSLEQIGYMTVAIKCPLFFQLALSKFNLRVINAQNSPVLESFSPSAADIKASDVVTSQNIADDIARTTEALFINPRAYQADGCDRFISQLITPISVYTTIIVSGSYSEWCSFSYQENVPAPLKAYGIALQQMIEAEWK